jgi:alkylhydroperoxidase/carboxymuconolactone decarboxylase family protein YurZ
VSVATLVPLDVPEQLRAHVRGALYTGSTRQEVRGCLEAALLLAPAQREVALAVLDGVWRRYAAG